MAEVERNRRERNDVQQRLNEDIVRAYANESGLAQSQVNTICRYAYEESHSSGIHEVIDTLESLIDLVLVVR